MQADVARIAREHGLALVGPNCMGVIDLTANAATYIGDVSPYLPRGGVAGIAQSGSVTDAFVHSGSRVGFSRIISCGSEVVLDVCDYLAYCLDDPETSSVILFVEGFKRPERFLALADRALELGKPIMAVKVGRSDQAQTAAIAHSGSLAGEARVTDAALDAAGVIRCRDLDELLETAELVEGVRRTGRRVGRGRTGVVTVSTGEASLIADLAPRTGVDLPPIPEAARAEILATCRRWATSATRSTRGAPPTRRRPMAPASRRWPPRAPTTCSCSSTTSRIDPRPPEVATANDVTVPAPGRDPGAAAAPARLRVADLGRAAARDQGGARLGGGRRAAPARRRRGVPGDRPAVAAWERRRTRRLTTGPWRPGWPELAADRTSFGADATSRWRARARGTDHGPARAREPGPLRSAGDPGDRGRPVADA